MKNIILKIFLTIAILAGLLVTATVFKNNKTTKIAFLGDSITEYGWDLENGYVRRVAQGLSLAGIHLEPIPAGIAGDTTSDMLQRLDKDILDKKPDIVFFMGGINDIWLFGGTLDTYSHNIENITDKIKQSGATPIIISLTLITEDINASENKKIDEFNNYLKKYTAKNNIQYIDVNTVLKNELKQYKNPKNVLTVDGVHMNRKGDQLLADTIITEFLKTYKH